MGTQSDEQLIPIFNKVTINLDDDYVIWGAGVIGERVLEKLKLMGITPLRFVDDINTDRWDQEISGIGIVSLSYAKTVFSNATYVLSSGYNHKIVPKTDGLKYIHYEELFYGGNEENITKAFYLLEDEESKKEYLFRLDYLNNPEVKLKPEEERYCFKMKEGEIIIDGGAYDGDSIRVFKKYKPQKIYAFEPDPKNFVGLWTNTLYIGNTLIFPFALYSNTGNIGFNAKGNTYSLVGGSTTVQSIAIDSMILLNKISRIKLDIEGSEKEALRGAKKTIKKDRPILAVCAYHRIEDLWEIPLLIHNIVPDYKFYLRRYDDMAWDGVCYGVPNERD